MKLLPNTPRKAKLKEQYQRPKSQKVIALFIALVFFNFSVLNSAHCKTFCQAPHATLENSPEIVITAEVVAKLKEDPHYLCKLQYSAQQRADATSSPAGGDNGDDSQECDFCYYCLVMLGGMAVMVSFPALALHIPPPVTRTFDSVQSIFVQAYKQTNTSRAPPLAC